ncbi:CBASS cGAMP-activated phospholipase [uncultured Tolumonas sp.]|uniref:CBASS cGAMP-activated phospholipase n=1 Tax=uncultured Tolumonas sp. TaxID=263765 RepID=UPI00292F3A4D|nr:CBASS cGAMP-activated phospholipase [uncultured Tolumonas sp.]
MQHMKKQFKILALNGGGVRGLFTVTILAELERVLAERHNDPELAIGDYFDMITGASIGGIIAIALADGQRARDLRDKFHKVAPNIFPRCSWVPNWVRSLYQLSKLALWPLYKANNLETAVTEIVGKGKTVRNLKRRLLIPTVNLSTGRPLFIKTCHNSQFTRDDQFSLIDVAMATSAAPTYFLPHYIEWQSAYFADGGLLANNPSFVAYHEALNYLDDKEFEGLTATDIKILNIGTLSNDFCVNPNNIKRWFPGYLGLWGGGKNLIETVMSSSQKMHGFMANKALNADGKTTCYFSLDETVPDQQARVISLDNASKESLKALMAWGKSVATTATGNKNLIDTFFNAKAPAFVHPNDQKEKT